MKSRSRRKSKIKFSTSFKKSFTKETSHYIPEMTWVEISNEIKEGRDTVILPIGGYEQNGPYVILDKHHEIIKMVLKQASKYVNILIGPVFTFTPGVKQTDRMTYPGTSDIPPELFMSLLLQVILGYQMQGFKRIVIVTDHGGRVDTVINPIVQTVDKFNSLYKDTSKAIFYDKFYDIYEMRQWLSENGINEVSEGYHDEIYMESLLSVKNLDFIRYDDRKKNNKLSINGIDISDVKKLIMLGKNLLRQRLKHIIPELQYIIRNK